MEVRMANCPLGAKCEEVIEENGRQVMLRCPWYTQLRGTDPNTGAERDEWACAIAWLPLLSVEVSKEVRQGAAATESFRNEVVTRADGPVLIDMAPSARAAPRLIEAEDDAKKG